MKISIWLTLALLLVAACAPTPTPVRATLEPIVPTMVDANGRPFVVSEVEANEDWQAVPVTDASENALQLPGISGYAYSYSKGTPGHLYVAYKKEGQTHSYTLYHPVGDLDERDWTVTHDMELLTMLKVEYGNILHFGIKGEFSLYGKPGPGSWQLAISIP